MTIPNHYHLRFWFFLLIGILALAAGVVADSGSSIPNGTIAQTIGIGAPEPSRRFLNLPEPGKSRSDPLSSNLTAQGT